MKKKKKIVSLKCSNYLSEHTQVSFVLMFVKELCRAGDSSSRISSGSSSGGSPESFAGLLMAQQCLSVVFVRLRREIWALRAFFFFSFFFSFLLVGGWKHVSGLHLIG